MHVKMFSDQAVTKDDLVLVDQKQTQQIKQLRLWLTATFLVNAALTVGLWYKMGAPWF